MKDIHRLYAHEMLDALNQSTFSSSELVGDCLKVIEAREEIVGAWAFLDKQLLLEQALLADSRYSQTQDKRLPLCGIPVGVKDIFDTRDLPTENGTSAHKGRRPDGDSAVVSLLRKAGAVIMGKTVTAELAVYAPGKTTNPHDPQRTPGGSSSGSAAAVAAGMVPMAVGTQTNGSVIRPASYCGVVGYKPTFGSIPRAGILKQSPSLDQVGVFSRSVLDSAKLASVLMDQSVPYGDTLPWSAIDLAAVNRYYSSPPRMAFARTPVWDQATTSTKEACLQYIQELPVEVVEIDLPEVCEKAVACHRTIMLSEMYHNYQTFYTKSRNELSPMLLSMLEEGAAIAIGDYFEAKSLSVEIMAAVDASLIEYDAVLTPATPSEAPEGLESTGSPIFCTLWSLSGVPALSMPLLNGSSSGMPLGLQVVGARGTDSVVLRAARWLEMHSMQTLK